MVVVFFVVDLSGCFDFGGGLAALGFFGWVGRFGVFLN